MKAIMVITSNENFFFGMEQSDIREAVKERNYSTFILWAL